MSLAVPESHGEGAALWPQLLDAARGGGGIASGLLNTPEGRAFAPLIRAQREDSSFVIGQIGQSLDGRCATASGQSKYINGEAALRHLHRLRALVDAVIVGVGTALADNPQLTVRHAEGPDPARVVIDPSGRLPRAARCLADDRVRRIVVRRPGAPPAPGLEVLEVAPRDGAMAPAEILEGLSRLGLRRILVEGGPRTLSRFLAAGCLDRLHVLVGPMIIGSGRSAMLLPEIADLQGALRPRVTPFAFAGGDLLLDCDFAPASGAAAAGPGEEIAVADHDGERRIAPRAAPGR